MSDQRLRHHGQLEQAFMTLVQAMQTEDPIRLRAEWGAFEHHLLEHLNEEERDQLPTFARRHPEEARAILAEHEQIRTSLLELGVQVDLHILRDELVREFIERLRAHAAREERLFYRWIEAQKAPLRALSA